MTDLEMGIGELQAAYVAGADPATVMPIVAG